MDRRTFLKAAGMTAAVAGCGAFAMTGKSQAANGPGLKNWVWVGGLHRTRPADEWKAEFALMKDSGISAIVAEIYDGRQAFYDSHRLPVREDVLKTILPLAKAAGLEVHAWMWSMPCMVPEIMQKHPDWYNVNAKGESAVDKPAYVDYYKFLDPGRPEVREWVQGTVKELAGIAELTGVHLDYIRHPDAILPTTLWKKYNIVQDKVYPPYDYGYTEYERGEFKKKFGLDPIKLPNPNDNQDWVKFRLDMVVDLVNQYLVPAAHEKNKVITAAVFPGPSLARTMVRQDWGRFNLDAFLPMLYNNYYNAGPEWIEKYTREGATTTGKPIYSGLYIGEVEAPGLTALVQGALKGGASGVSLFSSGGMNVSKWKAFKQVAVRS